MFKHGQCLGHVVQRITVGDMRAHCTQHCQFPQRSTLSFGELGIAAGAFSGADANQAIGLDQA
ncbi:hypothetical protein C8024_05260 [Sphingopyxis sp. BSNA05]|nr:hypothetical protein [Sphingopyxis sp. BSNA05]